MRAPAAPFALTPLFKVQRHAVYDQAVARFGDFGRAIECLPMNGREDGTVAIPPLRCAPAADLRFDDRVLAPGIGMNTADEGAGDGGEMAGRHLPAHMWREAPANQVVNPDADFIIKAHRSRFPCMENSAFAGQELDRPECALIGRQGRVGQRFEGNLRRDQDIVVARVERSVAPVRDCREGRPRIRCRLSSA